MPNSHLLPEKNSKLLTTMIAAGAVLLAGLLFAPERAWSNLFVAAFYLLTLALGGAVFVALTLVSGAKWNVAFRRVPEAMAAALPVVGVVILIILLPRMNHYAWHPHGEGDPGTFWFKEFWLTPSFWVARSIGYAAIWSLLVGWLVRRSRNQPEAADAMAYRRGNVRVGALFLVIYAVTFSLASADWIMALEPMWFSTMWGVYNFAGMILATLAGVVVLCVLLSAPGRRLQGLFTTEHLHDLGKLLVGFSCFWMYIWFSQYMLIWYSNIPEETSYFITRTHTPWGPVVVASITLNWLLPFFILLPRPAKRSRSVMVKVAVVLLVGRWVDLYVMVFPATVGDTPVFGIWEVAALLFVAAVGWMLVRRSCASASPVPSRDVYLQESLQYHA